MSATLLLHNTSQAGRIKNAQHQQRTKYMVNLAIFFSS